ncbi:uncharacterized protein PHACADRAFT_257543 [Phanerochaete carnosa HHB-10118-sp]|uniref:Uncharacterized protein n=1 Tax=Phanerochaete carnosa (strain HHB-10118-sp) TaxID=650164 RepID=K5UVF4_PHACS|nr:uncharacterized protein PHACADRAFT_257543 [Phanerochaete carnosa HHB-10118-sp]EKM53996.1 hypothetical protein PHACADRAFT_257543 [Phanerochaete carnosa HHB-10118-sp]
MERQEQVLIIIRKVVESIVNSHLRLAQSNQLPIEAASPLMRHLVETCKKQPAFADTMLPLRNFSQIIFIPTVVTTPTSAPLTLNPDFTVDSPNSTLLMLLFLFTHLRRRVRPSSGGSWISRGHWLVTGSKYKLDSHSTSYVLLLARLNPSRSFLCSVNPSFLEIVIIGRGRVAYGMSCCSLRVPQR